MRKPRPVPQITKSVPIPAPTLGINAVDGLSEMGPRDAIYSYNMYPGQYGLKVRNGYEEHATNVGVAGGGRTLIPYKGSSLAEDTLFCTSQEGIFDITASGSVFVALETFPTQNSTSGYGQFSAYETIGGRYMLYCDEANGYYYYDEDASDWVKPGVGDVTGVDPANLVAVTIHKERIWFVEKNTGAAWYLPVGQVVGAATRFNFGSRFKVGGYLVNLYSWTVDGGEGLDDYFVAVSSAGDVIVFKGTDPAVAANWGLQGSWFIGQPPAGRRVAGSFGGELYLLSSYGVIPITKLLSGAVVQEQNSAISERITPLIKAQMSNLRNSLGWEVQLIPDGNLLIVSVPIVDGNRDIQFVQSLNKTGWGIYRDLPYYTGGEWNGTFYFSDGAGTVYSHTGTVDNLNLAGTSSDEIEFSVLTAFQDLPPQGTFKRVQYARATFLSQGTPGYEITVRYDYQLEEGDPVITASTTGGALWDTAIWDSSFWGGGFVVTQTPVGGAGMGRSVALALRGNSSIDTTLVKFEVLFDGGNYL